MHSNGRLDAIFITGKHRGAAEAVGQAAVLEAQGLVGDRHCKVRSEGKLRRELTLVANEALEALRAEGIDLPPALTRRNLLTSGIDLNALVGQTFTIGDVVLRGVELCQPCAHLEKMTGLHLVGPMHDRGGLAAAILTDGNVRIGDPILIRTAVPD